MRGAEMAIGVVIFPGSNCDRDIRWAVEGCLGMKVRFLWHGGDDLRGIEAIALPGGFSYGDYLRCGAMARSAPMMESVASFAANGGPVIGICNGFQVLTEAGLLPGALTRNNGLNFICGPCGLEVNSNRSNWLTGYAQAEQVEFPIAHGEGCYQIDTEGLKRLQDNDQIALRYVSNPNGSIASIAGITNERGNVLGLMPHPERACDPRTGGSAGRRLFQSLLPLLKP